MTKFIAQKATKADARLRLAVMGPTGAGKTWTALEIATGIARNMNNKICLADTEHKSASKYADNFEFDTVPLDEYGKDPETMTEMLEQLDDYDVMIIDSLTHAWKELLDEINKLTRTKYNGNSYRAWSEGTPKQEALVEAILDYPGHVICTFRTKMAYEVNNEDDFTVKKVGLEPEQRDGIEYEFDNVINMHLDSNTAEVSKSRISGIDQEELFEKPGPELGQKFYDWLKEGVQEEATDHQINKLKEIADELIDSSDKWDEDRKEKMVGKVQDMSYDEAQSLIVKLSQLI